jgi:hypothetical protein
VRLLSSNGRAHAFGPFTHGCAAVSGENLKGAPDVSAEVPTSLIAVKPRIGQTKLQRRLKHDHSRFDPMPFGILSVRPSLVYHRRADKRRSDDAVPGAY